MKVANLAKGLSVGPAPHFDVVDTQGVVVAQAPHGIHTQVGNEQWKQHAKLIALIPNIVRELQNTIDQEAALGRTSPTARAMLKDLIALAPELAVEHLEVGYVWDEDKEYPVEDWRHEVAEDNTRLGYLEWVVHQREMNSTLEGPTPR